MSDGVPALDRHWSTILKSYRHRHKLYNGLAEARPVAKLEHELRLHIQAVLPYWQQLSPGASAEEVFATLMVYQLTPEAQSAYQAFIAQLADQPEIIQAVADAHQLSRQWLGQEAETETSVWQQALMQLLQHHQWDGLVEQISDQAECEQLFALALAARSGDSSVFNRLIDFEHTHPDSIFAAYWLSAQPAAYQRILAALETPHLAQQAATVWELLSGQTLIWAPTVGSLGGRKQVKGPQLPVIDTAQAWWQQQTSPQLPLVHGIPLAQTDLQLLLSTHCGRGAEPLWWHWQYQHRQYLPGINAGWHTERLAVLGNRQQHNEPDKRKEL